MRWIKTPWLVKKIFNTFIWDVPNNDNKIYLTFDDGPTPEITTWVLNELKKHNAHATFFCIGANVAKNPDLFLQIITDDHSIGNHTFNHLNGFNSSCKDYINNVELFTSQLHDSHPTVKTTLFRPPYGKIKPSQATLLRKLGYQIVLWDVISHDFDATISNEQCLKNATNKVAAGSIIVFHDSHKASEQLKYVLPKALDHFKKKGFVFAKL